MREGLGGVELCFSGKSLRLCVSLEWVVLEVVYAWLECPRRARRTRGRVARAPTRASKAAEGEGGKALNGAEHHQRDSARARGSPLYVTRIAAAPRGSLRTRAPSVEDWSACRSGAPQRERGQR